MIHDENLIEEIAKTVKANGDLSIEKKNRQLSPIINLMAALNSMPRKQIPQFDFSRVRDQILERIAIPKAEAAVRNSWMPRFFGIGTGLVGTLLIVVSLTLGTAVAALQSVPGQAIYPLKKVVENIQLKFTSDEEKTNLQLKFAENRAEEIQAVLEKQEQGQLSEQEAQKIVSATVQDLKNSTAAAASGAAKQPKVANKLADLTTKLKTASIRTEGEVKIEMEKAVASTKISQEEAIKNIENAGIKIEDKPINIDNSVIASGKLTAVTNTSVTIGTAKFLLTKDTKFEGTTAEELKVGQAVDISGETKDSKTYALKITLKETKIEEPTKEDSPANDETQ